jgi:YD repeat-containing protein
VKRRCVHTWGDGGIYERTLVYDDEAGTTKVTDSRGFTRVHHHDGSVVHRVEDPLGGITQTLFDDDYKPLVRIGPTGASSRYTYDQLGNRTAIQRDDGSKVSIEFDAWHRMVATTNEIGAKWTWRYDDAGRLRERTDAVGRTWTYTRTGLHDRIVDPEGGATIIERDAAFNVVKLRTPDGAAARWEYDGWGRPVCAISPTGAFEQTAFDLLGRPVRIHDLEGRRRDLSYDAAGHLVSVRWPDREIRVTYQGLGRVASRTEGGVSTRFGYDTEENPTAIVDAHGRARRFERDANGCVIAETDPSGRVRRYERDAAGRVVRVERPGGAATSIAYDKAGRVVEVRHSDDTFARYRWRRTRVVQRPLGRERVRSEGPTRAHHVVARGRSGRAAQLDGRCDRGRRRHVRSGARARCVRAGAAAFAARRDRERVDARCARSRGGASNRPR